MDNKEHIEDKINMLFILEKMLLDGRVEEALHTIEVWDHDLCMEMQNEA